MKNKFQNFNLGEVEVLTQAEQSRVKGGYPSSSVGGPVKDCTTKSCTWTFYDMSPQGQGWTLVTKNCTSSKMPVGDCLYVCPGPATCS